MFLDKTGDEPVANPNLFKHKKALTNDIYQGEDGEENSQNNSSGEQEFFSATLGPVADSAAAPGCTQARAPSLKKDGGSQ